MKAGRELDALIAEKVMELCGHYLIRDVRKGDDSFSDYITWTCEKCDKEFRGLSYGAGYKNPNLKHYSTQIADAWLVVEKVVKMGYYVDIGVDEHGGQVQLDSLGGKDINWVLGESIRADTAPLAICLATLKVAGE